MRDTMQIKWHKPDEKPAEYVTLIVVVPTHDDHDVVRLATYAEDEFGFDVHPIPSDEDQCFLSKDVKAWAYVIPLIENNEYCHNCHDAYLKDHGMYVCEDHYGFE